MQKNLNEIAVQLDDGAVMPTRAHELDAGYDLYAKDSARVYESYTFDTGVHIQIPKGYAGIIKSRSSMNIVHGLQSEGVVDAGYTGSIRVKLCNHHSTPYTVHAGDRIAQIVFVPIFTPELVKVDKIDGGDRGSRGFGSSGK